MQREVEVTDSELMTEVRDRDPSRLGELFDRHHQRLFRFFVRMTGRRELSEDLVQETFVRILRYRASYRGESGFAVWMYRIARNVLADAHGARRAREENLDDELPDPRKSPLELLQRDQEVAILERALASLPADQREVLVFFRFEGLRHEELARLLGCSVGAAKVRAHRALAQLRDIYLGMTKE